MRYSIYTNYSTICVVSILSFVVITGLSGFFIYRSYFKELDHRIQHSTDVIEQNFSEMLIDIERLILYAGKGIESSEGNLEKIFRFLNGIANSKYGIKEVITVFEWSDHTNNCVLNSEVGRLKKPLDITNHSYTKFCQQQPWKVHLGPPVYGITTGLWIIPGGVGITSKTGKYQGIISFGINISTTFQKKLLIFYLKP
jgi:hypothetical protein